MVNSTMAEQGEAGTGQDYDIYQDVISQFPFLNGYTHCLRGFEVAQSTSRDSVLAALQAAFDKLTTKVPWLAEQVVTVDAGPGASGFIKSIPWPASAPPNKVTRVDKDAELSSLATLLATGCPMASLEPDHLVPCPGLPQPHGLSLVPVMGLRAVFISGGVLVVMSAHHNMIDGIGLMQLWEHLGTLMSGGEISNEAIRTANTARTHVIPLLSPDTPVKDYSHLLRPDPWPLGPPPATEWCVFRMTRSVLTSIKAQASSTTAALISSDDALSAFCWQRICAVRLGSGRCRAEQVSKFGRAVSGRPAMGLSTEYLGHMMLHAATRLAMGEVVGSSLAKLAGLLRRDLDDVRTEWSVRSCATFMAGVADKSTLLYGGLHNPETDVGGTSLLGWAKRPPLRMGMLGESRFFRKPDGASIPGCMYFFPSDNDREVQIVLCLTREDLDGLGRDSEWSRYVKSAGRPERSRL